ncbi:MAG: bifunctional 5,10-methylenetetrahydrofolate dehydrogenase/5,10-methenyltetrahydrofolate cyclohydrolase [Candidatus Lokiarchaeota archaeon]|nr:bifunctional 5,10-methylenetetrahydrofolate dehydrogenase/5,10-methenyltetrahydrofolate cyclohydrolase [Candidatus Lokiarchaeota archaeon]MCK4479419.1 bifunctional 5,10-methylenetetrahydrofolate dehydrogenase/5,10-methenyltetrahydrofolate cyclohydrolase [Candidatus Lokiarchaeota archaeon]
MKSKILDGKRLADKLNSELKEKVKQYVEKTGIKPKLATILVGKDPASKIYVNIKNKTCQEVGIDSVIIDLDENISKEGLKNEINKLNNDSTIHGILLQLPLPKNLREYTPEFLEEIVPLKDADGLNPYNRGKLFDYNEELAACTPKGIIKLLEHYDIELKGKDVVIINRSNLVGKPLIFMLLKRNATVTICHTSTRDIDEYIRKADILIVAVRQPKFITNEKIKENVIIIDVSTNRVEGKLCGDVDLEDVLEKCQKITPVPGGIGPMTVAMLCENTFTAYKKQLNIS